MKVVRIVPLLDFGGVEQRLSLTVKGFENEKNIDLIIIVLGHGGEISKKLKQKGCSLIILNKPIKIPNLKLVFHLFKLLKELKPDIVHTSGAEANFHGLIAARLANIHIRIGEEIGFPTHDRKWILIFKGVYSFATTVITISASVKQRIIQLGEVQAEKVEVVYNPVGLNEVDLEYKEIYQNNKFDRNLHISIEHDNSKINKVLAYKRLSESTSENRDFIFVTTCRLVKIKNLNNLIKVFAEIVRVNNHLEISLWIVGEGNERINLEKLAQKEGVADNVTFWGFKQHVVPYLYAANVFVLPSFSEGFSISLVEAMLCKLPCIATNQGGPSEIIEDKVTGFLINPKNPLQLKNTMNDLIQMTPKNRLDMGTNAQQSARKYSLNNYIKRLLQVYHRN